ncbi:hypothetical protein [Arthrobacter wenxiniae]|uniref:Uncharacterized protein n=1 Tax=Arthrobacter wenxiniae TaxID=2713570 RepID=A0A7Y7M0V5_9MICC|nr:hypothetical protein [Arthrobacter wenxiniae]NVM96086.1 hypothetical protein [Arthrobacter wenxiniae]
MTPTPSPSPIDVVVHVAPAADWQVWAAFAPLIAAIIVALIAVPSLWQRHRADNRAKWWQRAQWALDASMSDQPTRAEMGQRTISLLGKSKLTAPEDGVLLKIGTDDPLEAANSARLTEVADALAVSDQVEVHLTGAWWTVQKRSGAMEGTQIKTQADRTMTMTLAHTGTPRKPTQTNMDSIAPSRRPASVTPEDRKVQIAAAKARITLNELTGDVTPDWITALSKEEPE